MNRIPSIKTQEKRDKVPRGTYQRLVDAGQLTIAQGLRVPPVGMLMNAISAKWGVPAVVSCDRFRLADLQDVNTGWELVPRVTRWSEASEDIRAIRSQTRDGPLSLAPLSRALIQASLAVCRVRNDDQGSVRLIKRGTNNTGRDDMAHAMALAAGAWKRAKAMQEKHSGFDYMVA